MTAQARLLAAISALALAAAPAVAFDLQGHRGARGLAPENTLPGFATALRIGVDTLEMDLGVTRDGAVVVSHDWRLNPEITRGPDGAWLSGPGPALYELDLAELQRYDVGRIRPDSAYAARFPEQEAVDGARIPTLAEVTALTREARNDEVRFNIETKLSPDQPELTPAPEDFARAVVGVVRGEGIEARTTIQSFDWRTLREVQRIAPEIPTVCLTVEASWLDNLMRGRHGAPPWTAGFDIDDFGGSVPDLVAAAGCRVWSPEFGGLRAGELARAHELGLRVIVWTVNGRDDMARLVEMGVDGIITDYPDRLRDVMAARGTVLPQPTPVGLAPGG